MGLFPRRVDAELLRPDHSPVARPRDDLDLGQGLALAQNVAESLEIGDPVIAIGKVRNEKWTTQDGEARESTVLEASLIGHDLTWGVTKLRRVERQAVAAANHDGTVEALEELEGQSAAPAA